MWQEPNAWKNKGWRRTHRRRGETHHHRMVAVNQDMKEVQEEAYVKSMTQVLRIASDAGLVELRAKYRMGSLIYAQSRQDHRESVDIDTWMAPR
jgi:hypothetical protein